MAKHPNSIKNPLSNGDDTYSKITIMLETIGDEASVTTTVMN